MNLILRESRIWINIVILKHVHNILTSYILTISVIFKACYSSSVGIFYCRSIYRHIPPPCLLKWVYPSLIQKIYVLSKDSCHLTQGNGDLSMNTHWIISWGYSWEYSSAWTRTKKMNFVRLCLKPCVEWTHWSWTMIWSNLLITTNTGITQSLRLPPFCVELRNSNVCQICCKHPILYYSLYLTIFRCHNELLDERLSWIIYLQQTYR